MRSSLKLLKAQGYVKPTAGLPNEEYILFQDGCVPSNPLFADVIPPFLLRENPCFGSKSPIFLENGTLFDNLRPR